MTKTTLMMIYPPLNKNAHFCGLMCLDAWREADRARAEKIRSGPVYGPRVQQASDR